ncbi:MAG: DUF616 domain-containing protein [Bacteroidia bacterium]|nr:DUF616 domain-containing protein [Bacteroidia bacterium]
MKKCLFTINFGNWDTVKEPTLTDGWDYILFTDKDVIHDKWHVIKYETDLPAHLAARNIYINAHKYIKDYDYSLMIGGQIQPDGDLNQFMLSHVDLTKQINILKHPCRKCIYVEAEIVKQLKLDYSEVIDAQMERYHQMGFPENFGLSACGIIGRWTNSITEKFEKAWWNEVIHGSLRDQLSFDFVRWKQPNVSINWIDYNILFGKYFSVYHHIKNGSERIGGL